jgi:flagellar motor switch protein FliN/FliY
MDDTTQTLLTTDAPTSAPFPTEPDGESPVVVRPVKFSPAAGTAPAGGALPLSRFYDVNVSVTVELGRASMRLSDLMRLGAGSIVELTRLVDQPVDILAQGVRLGRGEVVTVDDRYAVRIIGLDRLDEPPGA